MANGHSSNPVELPYQVRQVIAKLAVEHKATAKQSKFAELVVAGLTLTDAYRASYDTAMPTPWVDASKAAGRPKVSLLVTEGRAAMNHLRQSRGDEWKERIDQKLWQLTEKEDIADRDLIAALNLAGKQVHVDAWKQAQSNDEAKLDSLAEMLSAFQSELCESGLTIDITPVLDAQSQQTVKRVIYLTDPTPELWDGSREGSD